MIKTDYTREELLSICEDAFVPQKKWSNRDSAEAQKQLGWCYAWLKAGCEFEILTKDTLGTDESTIWVEITAQGFMYFESGEGCEDKESFYLPTRQRLEERKGGDWY